MATFLVSYAVKCGKEKEQVNNVPEFIETIYAVQISHEFGSWVGPGKAWQVVLPGLTKEFPYAEHNGTLTSELSVTVTMIRSTDIEGME